MGKFKVGDRVRFYYRAFAPVKGEGKIINLNADDVLVQFDNGISGHENEWFHVKQCRRLKPKKRREWWFVDGTPYTLSYDTEEEARRRVGLDTSGSTLKVVHVREVKKK